MKKSVKILFALSLFSFVALSGFSQDAEENRSGVQFESHEITIDHPVNDLANLEGPSATTDCKTEGGAITVTHEDKKFSGGKHGTIERTWIATDACGNEKRTTQYIMLKEQSAPQKR